MYFRKISLVAGGSHLEAEKTRGRKAQMKAETAAQVGSAGLLGQEVAGDRSEDTESRAGQPW